LEQLLDQRDPVSFFTLNITPVALDEPTREMTGKVTSTNKRPKALLCLTEFESSSQHFDRFKGSTL